MALWSHGQRKVTWKIEKITFPISQSLWSLNFGRVVISWIRFRTQSPKSSPTSCFILYYPFFSVYVCLCRYVCASVYDFQKKSLIHRHMFWANENTKKDELYCINVANYVHKLLSLMIMLFLNWKKFWELCRWVCL